MTLILLNEDELRQVITIADIVKTIETAFAALAEGRLDMPGFFTLNLPEVNGESRVKGAHLRGAPYYIIKVSNLFRDNPKINLPGQNELMMVFDAATGSPAALMVDNGYLTAMRAGAAGALAARYLAKEKFGRVAVIGSGRQAYAQVKALTVVGRVESVSVWGPTPINVDNYARLIVEDHDLDVEIAASIEAAVKEADLIITTTPSREPLIQADWLKPGVHITAVGSDTPNKQELHPDVLKRADVIVADNLEQCAIRGEIHHALAAGAITRADIQGELGDLMLGKIPGRTAPEQITVADLTGLDVQEITIAALALEKALFLGLGLRADSSTANIPDLSMG